MHLGGVAYCHGVELVLYSVFCSVVLRISFDIRLGGHLQQIDSGCLLK